MSLQQPKFKVGDITLRGSLSRGYINKIVSVNLDSYNIRELYEIIDTKINSRNFCHFNFNEQICYIDNSSILLSDELKAKLL